MRPVERERVGDKAQNDDPGKVGLALTLYVLDLGDGSLVEVWKQYLRSLPRKNVLQRGMCNHYRQPANLLFLLVSGVALRVTVNPGPGGARTAAQNAPPESPRLTSVLFTTEPLWGVLMGSSLSLGEIGASSEPMTF